MADKEKKITGKKSNIKVNPRTTEVMERHNKLAVESIQSKLQSLRENQDSFDCIEVDEFTDEELLEIAEEVLSEYNADNLLDICEAIESDQDILSERVDPKETQRRRDQAKDRLATGAAMKKAAEKSAKPSRGERLKSALKGAAKKVAGAAGKVAGEFSAAKAKQKEKAMSRPSSDGSSDGGSSSGSSSSSSSSSSSTSSAPRERKRDKIKRALKKGIGKVARAVSRGARGVARRMGEETLLGFNAYLAEGKCKKCGKEKDKDKVHHCCSTKVEHAEWGVGDCISEQHTLDEEGNITHYDVKFEHGLEENVSVDVLKTLVSEMHEHAINHDKNQEVLDEKKDDEGFAGQATSYKGVVIKRTESGYEVPRFNLRSNSVDSIKQMIDKEMAKVDESYKPDAANNYNGPLYAPWTAVEEGKKKGLWDNIHAKRKRGEKPAKKGDEDYPETLNVEGYGVGDVDQKIKTDRDGYSIPKDKRAAAKARLLAKAAAKRKEKGIQKEATYPSDFKKGCPVATKKKGRPNAQGDYGKKDINEKAPTYDKQGLDKFDRSKRMIRHKQDKYGVSTLKQRLKTGADHNIDNEKKAKMKEEVIAERGDFWHPDPDKDRKLGGPGANQRAREDRGSSKSSSSSSSSGRPKLKPGESYMQYSKRVKAMKTRKEETELQEKELSIDDQMRISREAAAKRKPYQPGDRQKQRAAQLKHAAKNAKKDTRTDAQKMTDATGPRPGSRYRGD